MDGLTDMGADTEAWESFDDAIQSLIDCTQGTNEAHWRMGDVVNGIREQFGPTTDTKLASAAGCSTKWIKILGYVASIWPEGERRIDVRWDIYRTCAYAVKDNPEEAHKWLNYALEHDMSAADLRRAIVAEQGGATTDSRMKAVRFAKRVECLKPHVRKLIPQPNQRQYKPYQEEWYSKGQEDLWAALGDPLTMVKAFEAEDR